MDKMTEQEGASLDVVGENIQALKTIFPEAFAEDKIDFDALRQLLGDVVDEGEEKYGLNWHGKKKARQIALTPSTGTLRPCAEESVDWDTTQNLFIEGDNLEVLKLLQKSYANKVKMIYIDPPYNTGKEFIYPDKYQDNLDTYLRYTGQKGEEGFKTSSNTESSGRYHTNWLNMMYPRLKLARNLLRDDGVIFISIDEKEVTNLRSVCDELFGEENFISEITVVNNLKGRNDREGVATCHEYLLIYKRIGYEPRGLPLSDNKIGEYDQTDEKGEMFQWRDLRKRGGADTRRERPNLYYPIYTNLKSGEISLEHRDGFDTEIFPLKSDGVEGCWRWGKKKVAENIAIIRARKAQGKDSFRVLYRVYLVDGDAERRATPKSTWIGKQYSTDSGTKSLSKLFPELDAKLFTAKAVGLLKEIVQQSMWSDDIVLDFFSGSGTLAQAVLELGHETNDEFRFIMVQLPEPCSEKTKAIEVGYNTIAEVGKERIRRTAAKIKEGTPGYEGDLGFKVFKLDSSNIRAWNPDRNDLEGTLYEHIEHLVSGRSEEDILYELLLKRGVDLTVPIESKEINGKTVYSIGYGVLFACLNATINRDEVEALAQGIADWHNELSPASDTQVVFRDSAFADDVAKTNMTAILEQNGIKHVRSL